MSVSEILGGCLCGTIRYQLTGTLRNARSCHCSRCRKAFSGAGSAYAEVAPGSSFCWVEGKENLQRYDTGGGWSLAFCGTCGTTICGIHADTVHGLTLGSVDGDPGVDIEQHIFVGSRAPWDHIGGDAPQFEEHPL